MGVPAAVADAAALLGTSGSEGGDEGDGGSDPGIALARCLYAGLAAAWGASATAAVCAAVSALARAAGPRVEARPGALGQLVRLVRLGLLLLTEAPVVPAASRSAAGARGKAAEIFEAAGAATAVRFHPGAAIALGAAGGFAPPARLAVSPVAPPGEQPQHASLGHAAAGGELPRGAPPFSVELAAWLCSPAGVSLAACALARRSAAHAAGALLDAAAALPPHTATWALALRRPALSAAFSALSGGALVVLPLESGLLGLDPPPPPAAAIALRGLDSVLDGTFGRPPVAGGSKASRPLLPPLPDESDSAAADLAAAAMIGASAGQGMGGGLGPT